MLLSPRNPVFPRRMLRKRRARGERTGRNPRTKESIVIPASKQPVFKAGKAFKDAVAK